MSLSAVSGQTVTVNFGTADGTATAGSGDYVAAFGTVTFPPGTTTQTITVVVNGDTLDEPNETFLVNLSSPTNATLSDSQGVGTITDDDPAPSISINDVTVAEGNAGTVNAVFTATLSPASSQTVTVQYATANGTATAGSDYVGIPTTTLTFNPGETSKTVTVQVNGDTLNEANETFFVNLSGATNATISDGQGQGTILDNDPVLSTVTIQATDAAAVEPANTGTFRVSRTGSTAAPLTVFYTVGGTATPGSDYTALPGSVTIPAGSSSAPITVTPINDALMEGNETVVVTLTPRATYTVGTPSSATVTISSDE